MLNHETFPNAPISEAVADVAVRFAVPPTLGELERFGSIATDRFPTRRERRTFQTSVTMREDEPIFTNTERKFLSFTSPDEKHVVQVRPDGFAFSRLKPYVTWKHFLENALDAWTNYVNIFKPEAISRISLKYINRIQVPNPVDDFEKYFTTGIKLAPELPQAVDYLFYSFSVPDPALDAVGIVHFAIDREASNQNAVSLVFDVEARHTKGCGTDTKEVGNVLVNLRDLKNKLFFGSMLLKKSDQRSAARPRHNRMASRFRRRPDIAGSMAL